MELLVPSAYYFFIAILILVIYRIYPKFKYFWLFSFINALIIWVYVWVLGIRLPLHFDFSIWEFITSFQPTIALRIDSVNWPILLIVSTIMLAVITSDAARPRDNHWWSWSGGFGIVGVGMLAILSANLFTLLFLWVVVDITQLVLGYVNSKNVESQRNSIMFFITNIMGIMVAIGVFVISSPFAYQSSSFETSASMIPLLIFAAGLRLGVLPLQAWFLQSTSAWEENFLPMKLIPLVSSLILLVRIAKFGNSSSISIVILLLTLIAGIYGASAWIQTKKESHSSYYLTLALSTIVMISSLYGDATAALSWTLVLLSVSGFWIIYSARHKKYLPIILINVILLVGFPFTPNYAGLIIFEKIRFPMSILVLLIPILVIFGLVSKFKWNSQQISDSTKWVPILYSTGLLFLPITHGLLILNSSEKILFTQGNLYWIISLIIFTIIYWLMKQNINYPVKVIDSLGKVFSLKWFYAIFAGAYNLISLVMNFISQLFESRAGIIWSLIFFTLVVSIIAEMGVGLLQ
jgi:hypothetical protein